MSGKVSLALVGIGGYGNAYVNMVLDGQARGACELVAAVDPNPSACRRLDELKTLGVPLYPSLESFYDAQRAELVVLSTPIALHAPQTALACARGSNVLCEKPLCATLEDALAMRNARDRFARHVAIGYQWSFSDAIQSLKADVLAGAFGRAVRLRTIVLWPRDEAYYGRNRWAGAQHDARGNVVWDSPVNNACAHYLHNMLYVIGSRVDRSAEPATVIAELYRAHPIENFDTGCLRIETRDGVELLFVVSHATIDKVDPTFSYEFERGTVQFAGTPDGEIVAQMNDGTTKNYGSPNVAKDGKLISTIQAVLRGVESVCGIEASVSHTRCVVAAQESVPKIVSFPRELLRVTGEPGHRATSVDGLDEVLHRCYASWCLPSELDVSWARPGTSVSPEAFPNADARRTTDSRPFAREST